MLCDEDRANQLVVDEAARDVQVGLIDGVTGRRRSRRRHEMVEGSDFIEQTREFSLLRHVGGEAADAALRRESTFGSLQLLLRSAHDHHLSAIREGGGRDAQANAGTAANDKNSLSHKRCHGFLQI